jgi:hypothetical protein
MKKGVETTEMLNATKRGPNNVPTIVNVFPEDVNTTSVEPGAGVPPDDDETIVIVCPGTNDAFGTVI